MKNLRDRCQIPSGLSAEGVKHYQEVIDAIEQIYPTAKDFIVIVDTEEGRVFWDVSQLFTALGLVEAYKAAQIAGLMGVRPPGPNQGEI